MVYAHQLSEFSSLGSLFMRRAEKGASLFSLQHEIVDTLQFKLPYGGSTASHTLTHNNQSRSIAIHA